MNENDLKFWIRKGFFVAYQASFLDRKPIQIPFVDVGFADKFPIPIIQIIYLH